MAEKEEEEKTTKTRGSAKIKLAIDRIDYKIKSFEDDIYRMRETIDVLRQQRNELEAINSGEIDSVE